MLVSDYLRVAANKAEVVAPLRTLGFHTSRRTLAWVLVKMEVDPKLVQEMLRHQNLKTTLEVSSGHDQRQARSPGDVPGVAIPRQEGLGESGSGDGCGAVVRVTAGNMENEKWSNCFEMWWPGTELNRHRQPFQGYVML